MALLVPVPLAHLEAGVAVSAKMGRVAFGTRAWKIVRSLNDQKAVQSEIDVYIYASLSNESLPARVTWTAQFVQYVDSKNGAHPVGPEYRPPSTIGEDVSGPRAWAGFWEVSGLTRLPEDQTFLVHELTGFGKTKSYKKGYVPEGPTLVHVH